MKKVLKNSLVAVLILVAAVAAAVAYYTAFGGAGSAADESAVALRVGDHTVSVVEFEEAMGRHMPENHLDLSAAELGNLKRNLLDQIIEEELVTLAARKKGIVITDEELERELAAARLEYGAEDFDGKILARYGSIEKWKAEARRKLYMGRVFDTVIKPKIEVTEEDAKAYYEKNINDYEVPEQVRARMIVVETEKDAAEALARVKAKKKKDREEFEEVAIEVSISPEGPGGGDLGFFGRGDMPPEFEEVVFDMKKGGVSDVVKTPYGYHIFKVEEKRKGRKLKFEDVKEEITERLRGVVADKEFHEWIESFKGEVDIVVKEGLIR